jgi:predicted transcriptional regulator
MTRYNKKLRSQLLDILEETPQTARQLSDKLKVSRSDIVRELSLMAQENLVVSDRVCGQNLKEYWIFTSP